jgi:glutathione-regulated potassium-efflux system ancillary protein KefC
VLGSIACITLAGWALGFDLRVALIAGMALSLSSTALALAPLTERGALATKGGQGTFAVLLFQDIAVIPMLAVLPLLGSGQGGAGLSLQKVALALAVIVVTLGGGACWRGRCSATSRAPGCARSSPRSRCCWCW